MADEHTIIHNSLKIKLTAKAGKADTRAEIPASHAPASVEALMDAIARDDESAVKKMAPGLAGKINTPFNLTTAHERLGAGRDDVYKTPFAYAAEHGNLKIFNTLAAQSGNIPGDVITAAARSGNNAVMEAILGSAKEHPGANYKSSGNISLPMLALVNGHKPMYELLLEKGAKLTTQDFAYAEAHPKDFPVGLKETLDSKIPEGKWAAAPAGKNGQFIKDDAHEKGVIDISREISGGKKYFVNPSNGEVFKIPDPTAQAPAALPEPNRDARPKRKYAPAADAGTPVLEWSTKQPGIAYPAGEPDKPIDVNDPANKYGGLVATTTRIYRLPAHAQEIGGKIVFEFGKGPIAQLPKTPEPAQEVAAAKTIDSAPEAGKQRPMPPAGAKIIKSSWVEGKWIEGKGLDVSKPNLIQFENPVKYPPETVQIDVSGKTLGGFIDNGSFWVAIPEFPHMDSHGKTISTLDDPYSFDPKPKIKQSPPIAHDSQHKPEAKPTPEAPVVNASAHVTIKKAILADDAEARRMLCDGHIMGDIDSIKILAANHGISSLNLSHIGDNKEISVSSRDTKAIYSALDNKDDGKLAKALQHAVDNAAEFTREVAKTRDDAREKRTAQNHGEIKPPSVADTRPAQHREKP